MATNKETGLRASQVFNERVNHLRDGLQMMGLTDRAFYTTIYAWFGIWCCAAVFVATCGNDARNMLQESGSEGERKMM